MSHPMIQRYHGSYDPCGPSYSADPCCSRVVVCYVPVACAPVPGWYGSYNPLTVPHELAADAASGAQEALIGGKSDAHLSLEYLVESGAPAPQVTVTVTSDGTTSTWTDTGIVPGYHVKETFIAVKPGAKVKLEVTDALARLRWCETICC